MDTPSLGETEIKDMVRTSYGQIAAGTASSCCDTSLPFDKQAENYGYSAEDIAAVPEGANLGLGCGNPQAIAAMRSGETVVDLGSGAGFDCFLAARQVGPTGHVIGVDMTHEMLARARANAAKLASTGPAIARVEFRLGEIEHLPIADNTADVILSNCVVNLVPDKAQVFREAFRVLKPGGRLAISDVINIRPLPEALASDQALVCGCVAGAAPATEVEAWLAAAGFRNIRLTVKEESRATVAGWAPGRGIEDYVVAAIIEASKPTYGEPACCAPAAGGSCCA